MKKIKSGYLSGGTLIVANLIPLGGVLFFGWEPVSVFVFYIFETILVGLFTVLKMLTVYFTNRDVAIRREPDIDTASASGFVLIPFFLFHYFFFVFIQTGIFFALTGFVIRDFKSPFHLFNNLMHFISAETSIALAGLVMSQAISYAMDFMLSGDFKTTSLAQLMSQPYSRIFIQQFAVILGGFVFILFNLFFPEILFLVFIVIFSLVKIYFDFYYPKMMEGGVSFRNN